MQKQNIFFIKNQSNFKGSIIVSGIMFNHESDLELQFLIMS